MPYLIITLAFIALSYKDAKIALTVLFGLLPLYLIQIPILIPTNLFEVLAVAFIVTQLPKTCWKKTKSLLQLPLTRPLLLLLAAACFGVVIANDTLSALGIWKSYFILPAMLYIASIKTYTEEKDWRYALTAIATSAIALSLFAIFQATTGIGAVSPWNLDGRFTSLFPYPNALGLFLAPITAASAVLALQKPQRALWIATTLFGTIGIILAETEAALAAIPLALLITFLLSKGKTSTKIRISANIFMLGILALAYSPFLRQKLFFQDTSGQTRIAQWKETIELFKTKPLTGVGLNEYPNALKPFHDGTFYEIFQYPHNIFLNTWAELGLLGVIALVWIAINALQITHKHNRNILTLAAFAALATMAIHGLVDVPYFKNDLSVLTWFFLALLTAPTLSKLTKNLACKQTGLQPRVPSPRT